jgi:hypothetical protein
VTFSGGWRALPSASSEEQSRTVCLGAPGDASAFPHRLVQGFYLLHPGCNPKRLPREGNLVGGEISCPADPKMAEGMNRFAYSGLVAEDHVRIDVQMKLDAAIKEGAVTAEEAAQMKLAKKMIDKMRFVIEAKRTGPCA